MIKKFEDLEVYQIAFSLVLQIYKLTAKFPSEERFGLTNQIRRASVSIISNIAEGSMRLNPAEFRQFVGIARGSTGELRCQLQLATELKFLSQKDFSELNEKIDSIGKMLTNLSKTLHGKAIEKSSKS